MTAYVNVLAAITWSPGFRGILVVAVGVLVLMGSVYLLLATNTGARLGFLLALTGLMGWMTIMGLVWSMYGIGKQGPAAVLEGGGSQLRRPHPDRGGGRARRSRSRTSCPTAESFLEADPELAEQFPVTEGVKRPGLGDLLGVDPELEEQLQDDLPEGWVLLASSDPPDR